MKVVEIEMTEEIPPVSFSVPVHPVVVVSKDKVSERSGKVELQVDLTAGDGTCRSLEPGICNVMIVKGIIRLDANVEKT